MRRPSSGSSPGILNTAFVTALLVLFAGFALTSRQAGPPPIAEFAPQALKQIDEAPEDSDLSRSGTGSGARGAGGGGESPPPETVTVPEETEQPKIGPDGKPTAPPRFSATCANGLQNRFDPQSPPCMPFVPTDMDNGGATSPGVTRDVIKVGWALDGTPNQNTGERQRAAQVLANFFSENFVLYNRRIEVVDYSEKWLAAFNARDDAQWRALAADLDAQGIFAVFGNQVSTEFEYELARKGVISINADTVQTEAGLQQYSPYLYAYAAGGDVQADGLTSFACQKLAGKTSEFAGVRPGNVPRKFAIFVGESPFTKNRGELPQQMAAQLKRKCGVVVDPKHIFYDRGDASEANNNARQAWQLSFVDSGGTTILAVGEVFTVLTMSGNMEFSGYQPELVSTSFTSMHINFLISAFGKPSQRQSFINVNYGSQYLQATRTPGFATIRYQDPQWQLRPQEGSNMYNTVYKPMLVLAAGIQLAGPNLTPTTFRDGLQRTRFPNPPDPRAIGKVGFDTGDHTFVDDAIESFWAEGATGPDGDTAGAWCYPTQQRHGFQGRADWGNDTSRYFKQPCETGRGV